MDISRKYKDIFYGLYVSSKGLLAYTLYSRYALEPSDAIDFIDRYVREGIISVDKNQRISLTSKGRAEIIPILNILASTDYNECNNYLCKIKSDKTLKVFEPYLPNKKIYDNKIGEGVERN